MCKTSQAKNERHFLTSFQLLLFECGWCYFADGRTTVTEARRFTLIIRLMQLFSCVYWTPDSDWWVAWWSGWFQRSLFTFIRRDVFWWRWWHGDDGWPFGNWRHTTGCCCWLSCDYWRFTVGCFCTIIVTIAVKTTNVFLFLLQLCNISSFHPRHKECDGRNWLQW